MERCPEKGEIAINGERYILARAATFGVQLKKILGSEYGTLAAERISYDLGRAAGTKDAVNGAGLGGWGSLGANLNDSPQPLALPRVVEGCSRAGFCGPGITQ